jgi:hypothetical protein
MIPLATVLILDLPNRQGTPFASVPLLAALCFLGLFAGRIVLATLMVGWIAVFATAVLDAPEGLMLAALVLFAGTALLLLLSVSGGRFPKSIALGTGMLFAVGLIAAFQKGRTSAQVWELYFWFGVVWPTLALATFVIAMARQGHIGKATAVTLIFVALVESYGFLAVTGSLHGTEDLSILTVHLVLIGCLAVIPGVPYAVHLQRHC